MAVGKRNVRWGAFKIPGLQVKSVRFISTIEDDHKVKVRKVIVTASEVISRVPGWRLNINKIVMGCIRDLTIQTLCTPCVVLAMTRQDCILSVS